MKKRTLRIIAAILAFVIFFEPIALQAVKAAETTKNGALPEPTVIDTDGALMDPDDILAPHDYLDIMLDARGHTQSEVELRAWGEWQELINSAYLVIDEGATDVFGLYDALKLMKKLKTDACEFGSNIKDIAKYAHMATAFFQKVTNTGRATTALKCWDRMNQWTEKFVNWTKTNKALDFLSFCSAPKAWNDTKNAAKGMNQYWHWLQKKGGKNVNTELTNAQGVARTIGIGFSIIGTVLSVWKYEKNEDRQTGRWSYNRVKDLVALNLAMAGLIAMFCIPVVGQVLAIVTTIWGIVTYVGDLIGDHNKRWKDAYKNSYWYLYEQDPQFRSYYDNRESLHKEEKSASLLLVEEKYADYKPADASNSNSKETTTTTVQEEQSEEDKDTQERNAKIYTALEKTGVLASYYCRSEFKLPEMSIFELMDLWKAKANYMGWKPTEAEAGKKKGFLDYVGAAVNPNTYVKFVANAVGSRDYKEKIKRSDVKQVYFNPDFILLKRYIQFVTARKLLQKDDFYRCVGLRIEQSPFNYIPLVGIDREFWSEELIQEAFVADSFIVAQKEMAAIHNQIEFSVQGLDESIDEADKLIKRIDKEEISHAKDVREFLDDLAEAYNSDPDKENGSLSRKATKLLGSKLAGNQKKTPANIIKAARTEIEKALMYEPLNLGQDAADMVLMNITIKQHLDMSALMNAYLEDRQKMLDEFDQDFKNPDIRMYLKEGTFLNVKGSNFLDWLSELYSSYDDAEKTLKQIRKDVGKYDKLAEKGASNKRSWGRKIATPVEVIDKINSELSEWKSTVSAWSDISSETNVKVVLAENPEFAEKIWSEYKTEIKLESLDPDDESITEIDLPPYCVSGDSTTVEGAAEALAGN